MEHRGISFSVVEMSFPLGWKWTVGKGATVTVGVCATRLMPTFRSSCLRRSTTFTNFGKSWATHKLIDSRTALSI